MNANGILKTFLSALKRRPLEDSHPELKLYLQFETAEIEFPALIASCSLTALGENLAKNYTAEFSATFSLCVPADDYDTDEHDYLIAAVDARLHEITDENFLNTHAEEIGAALIVYSIEWTSTSEQEIDDERRLSLAWTFTGQVQL